MSYRDTVKMTSVMPLISIMGFREDGSDFEERYRSAHRRVAGASKRCVAFLFRVGQHAALDLVSFPTCEKRLEIALAETVIALALDVLEKKRTTSIAAESTGRSNLIENGN